MGIIGWSVVQKPKRKPKLPKNSMSQNQKSNYNKVRTMHNETLIQQGKRGDISYDSPGLSGKKNILIYNVI